MAKFLHTADIHLQAPPSEDSSYSLECLRAIIDHANQEDVDAILFCGDIFNSEKDYLDENFLHEVIEICDSGYKPIYYIPGNHENISGNFDRLRSVHTGRNLKIYTDPSIIHHSDEVEILAVPHRLDYDKYVDWEIPSIKANTRIAIAHGEIPGFQFLGDEESAGVLNSAIFLEFQAMHVFLGHIHLQESITDSGVSFYYAGSPRVVRRKEMGVRGYNIIEISDTTKVSRRNLPEMGLMHRFETSILLEDWESQIENQFRNVNSRDRVRIEIEGLINEKDSRVLDDKIQRLNNKVKNLCRRVEIIKSVEPIGNLTQNPFYNKVYDHWLKYEPANHTSREYKVWLHAFEKLKYLSEKVLP